MAATTDRDRRIRIKVLKSQAKVAWERWKAESGKYDCGNALLKEVSGRASEAARDFNAAMEELRELDPDNFPKTYAPL